MVAFDILILATIGVWLFMKPGLLLDKEKVPTNDLRMDHDRFKDMMIGNRSYRDDPDFFRRKI
jgi:hypothetical protein